MLRAVGHAVEVERWELGAEDDSGGGEEDEWQIEPAHPAGGDLVYGISSEE